MNGPHRVPAIEVNQVRKHFAPEQNGGWRWFSRKARPPFVAVDDVSFRVDPGEAFGLLGVNGSGKSTLIRLISTLLFPDSGEIEVFGHNVVKERHMVRRMLNRVSVEASFFKKLSPLENLLYAARLYNMTGVNARAKVSDLLRELGFADEKIRSPLENLSRGMQQKVAIARALMTQPKLLMLDEPTTGLDPKSKRDVQQLVRRMREEFGVTVLLTTHDMEEAEKLCDRIAIIDKGRLIALGTAKELKAQTGMQGRTLEDVFFSLVGKDWEEAMWGEG